MFFKKKSKKQGENKTLIQSLHGREVKYVTKRNPINYEETIIGKDGIINVRDDKLTIICKNKIVFTHPLDGLEAGELLSLEGVNLSYKDASTNLNMTIVAYYKYYRK